MTDSSGCSVLSSHSAECSQQHFTALQVFWRIIIVLPCSYCSIWNRGNPFSKEITCPQEWTRQLINLCSNTNVRNSFDSKPRNKRSLWLSHPIMSFGNEIKPIIPSPFELVSHSHVLGKVRTQLPVNEVDIF